MILRKRNSCTSIVLNVSIVALFGIFLMLTDGIVDAKIVECADKPCKNGGECISTQRMYTGNKNELLNYECICSGRWAGFNCEDFILDELSDKESDESVDFVSDDVSVKKSDNNKKQLKNQSSDNENTQLTLKKGGGQNKERKQNSLLNDDIDDEDDFEKENEEDDNNELDEEDVNAISCDLKCLNNGKCLIKKAKPYCKCKSGYRGELCGISK